MCVHMCVYTCVGMRMCVLVGGLGGSRICTVVRISIVCKSCVNCGFSTVYRVAKTHRIPYLYRSFFAKVAHI